MSKSRLLECSYDPEAKMATCAISSPYDIVYGIAFLNRDHSDDDVESEYVGCTIAKFRAETELKHRKAESLRLKYLGAKTVYDEIARNDDGSSAWLGIQEKALRVMNNYYKQYRSAKDTYDSMAAFDAEYCNRLVNSKREIKARIDALENKE